MPSKIKLSFWHWAGNFVDIRENIQAHSDNPNDERHPRELIPDMPTRGTGQVEQRWQDKRDTCSRDTSDPRQPGVKIIHEYRQQD